MVVGGGARACEQVGLPFMYRAVQGDPRVGPESVKTSGFSSLEAPVAGPEVLCCSRDVSKGQVPCVLEKPTSVRSILLNWEMKLEWVVKRECLDLRGWWSRLEVVVE